jgi:metallo-beta-lactamase family protein
LNEEQCKQLCEVAKYTSSPDESKKLDVQKMPKIIISASGMAEGGRILYHLKAYAPDPKSTILFTGYQATSTRGAKILAGEREIKIHGQPIIIRARVESITSTSAHADYQELLEWLGNFVKPPKKVFITHGEPEAALSLKDKISEKSGWSCIIPKYLQTEVLK